MVAVVERGEFLWFCNFFFFFFFLAYNQGRLFGCKDFVGFIYIAKVVIWLYGGFCFVVI